MPDVTPQATPGQAARKAWRDHWDIAGERGRGKPGWDSLAYEAECWDAAAEAAVDASDSIALAQLASAQEAISDLAADLARCRQALESMTHQRDALVRAHYGKEPRDHVF